MRIIPSVLALALSASVHAQNVSIVVSPGATLFVEENQILNQERNIAVEVVGNPDAALTITATSGSSAIRYLRVRSRRGTGFQTGLVVVTVQESGGSVAHIREISRLPTLSQAELGIGLVGISGTAGPPDGPDGSAFQAEYINRVIAVGDVTANMIAGPPLFGTRSTIARIESTSGDVLGDISALYGAVDDVLANNGNIGSPSDPVSVQGKLSVKTVAARQIWADVDALANGGAIDDSQVWRVSATNGDFTGTIYARRIEGTGTPGIYIPNGDLNADIELTEALRQPISVGGSLPAGRTISMARNMQGDGING